MKIHLREVLHQETAEELATVYAAKKKAAEQAKQELALAEWALIERMQAEQRKSVDLVDGGKYQRATYVRGETTAVHEEGLQQALGKVRYRKYCDLKINKKKLEQALEDGDLTVEEVAPYLSTSPNKPYIRYSEGATNDDQSA